MTCHYYTKYRNDRDRETRGSRHGKSLRCGIVPGARTFAFMNFMKLHVFLGYSGSLQDGENDICVFVSYLRSSLHVFWYLRNSHQSLELMHTAYVLVGFSRRCHQSRPCRSWWIMWGKPRKTTLTVDVVTSLWLKFSVISA